MLAPVGSKFPRTHAVSEGAESSLTKLNGVKPSEVQGPLEFG